MTLAPLLYQAASGGQQANSYSDQYPDNSFSQNLGNLVTSVVGGGLNFAEKGWENAQRGSSVPAFAAGTPAVSDDTWALVGEQGPELAYLSKGTTVVPNSRTGGALAGMSGGGGDTYNLNVGDGITRTELQMTVDSTMRQYVPHIKQGAVKAAREQQARRPTTRR